VAAALLAAWVIVGNFAAPGGRRAPAAGGPGAARDLPGPGRAMRVDDAAAGQLGYYEVFLPFNYSEAVSWPVIFYYHPLGGEPGTDTISELVGREDFIIVGMGYQVRGMEGYDYLTTRDIPALKHVLEELRGLAAVDRTRLFVSGFSKGGFYAFRLFNELPDLWAGAVILGAGARGELKKVPSLAGKPVFVGCGRRDRFLEDAVNACRYYRSLGCSVTYESWPGVGHTVGPENSIGEWFHAQARGGVSSQKAHPRGGAAAAPVTIAAVAAALAALLFVLFVAFCRPRFGRRGTARGPASSSEGRR